MEYFGTDGIRGIYGKELSGDVAFRCGNAIARIKPNCKVIVGRDNRPSGQNLSKCLCLGLVCGGADVLDIGVASTPAVSYLTRQQNCDFGVVISASHNPVEYNGIKVFSARGTKIDDKTEILIEELMKDFVHSKEDGKYVRDANILQDYIGYLVKQSPDIKGMRFAVDCSNGASRNIAHQLFDRLGANVKYIGMGGGKHINNLCGATYPQKLAKFVENHNLDFGFCFDGDADRIIVVGRHKVYDGDNILNCLSKRLNPQIVVGTLTTNIGLEKTLESRNIKLVRANVGDKYVTNQMLEYNTCLGGEQSGHIVISNLSPTGDGLLVALVLLDLFKYNSVDNLMNFERYPQCQINIQSQNPKLAITNVKLIKKIEDVKNILGKNGRVLVRPSGTENKVRVMVEANDKMLAEKLAKEIAQYIK